MMKSIIAKYGDFFLNKYIQKFLNESWLNRRMKELYAGLDYKFVVHHKKNTKDLLSQLCDKYGSDKGSVTASGHNYPWAPHTYTDFYSRLFSHCRHTVKAVFECGLGTNNPNIISNMGVRGKPGASLRVWQDYFENALIFGADIDRNILFQEDRIKTFYIDQLDPVAIGEFWKNVGPIEFDFIVDDGLHTFEAGVSMFENSIQKLAGHGIYIIEDVTIDDLLKFKKYFTDKDFIVDYVNMHRPDTSLNDNNIVVIRRQ